MSKCDNCDYTEGLDEGIKIGKNELLLRNAIVNKEWIIAQANADIAKFGEWTCNYREPIESIDREIESLIKE